MRIKYAAILALGLSAGCSIDEFMGKMRSSQNVIVRKDKETGAEVKWLKKSKIYIIIDNDGTKLYVRPNGCVLEQLNRYKVYTGPECINKVTAVELPDFEIPDAFFYIKNLKDKKLNDKSIELRLGKTRFTREELPTDQVARLEEILDFYCKRLNVRKYWERVKQEYAFDNRKSLRIEVRN